MELSVPGTYAIRASQVSDVLVHTTYHPSLCVVAQGAKRVVVADEHYEYDESRLLVVAVELPVVAQVTRASLSQPFLAFRLDFDVAKIAELTLKVFPTGFAPAPLTRAIHVSNTQHHIMNALIRLLTVMHDTATAPLLAPLIIDEILIRLLQSPLGQRIAMIGQVDSQFHKINRAVQWIRMNYAHPIQIEALAALVHMSVSSLHQHFKEVTAMSPLQYQKVLRLQEARRLLLAELSDVGMVAHQVGYQSASQFSREYRRYFGMAPLHDMRRFRASMPLAGAAPP